VLAQGRLRSRACHLNRHQGGSAGGHACKTGARRDRGGQDAALVKRAALSLEEIRAAILAASAGVEREMSKPRDFAGAKLWIARLKKEGRLNEAARA